MSIVTLQIGQCGNQIGHQLFDTIYAEANPKNRALSNEAYKNCAMHRFFDVSSSEQATARAVMIDTELKVMRQVISATDKAALWRYNSDQTYSKRRGSGNNWAQGYCGHGPQARGQIMEKVRREVEKIDRLDGFLCIVSLAGGTGSGVGSHATRCLRDDYPHSFIVNQVIAPYSSGEVIVQNYNTVLTLASLYENSDALMYVHNEQLHKICTDRLNIKHVSFKDINSVLCHQLAGVFLPQLMRGNKIATLNLGDILKHLVSHPDYKLLTIKHAPQLSSEAQPFSTLTWPSLMKELSRLHRSESAAEGVNQAARGFPKSVANILFTRGRYSSMADVSVLKDERFYPSWVPEPYRLMTYSSERPFYGLDKSVVLMSNCQTVVSSIDCTVQKAWNMFTSRAYLHQYARHGLEEDAFMNSFATVEQILHNYSHL